MVLSAVKAALGWRLGVVSGAAVLLAHASRLTAHGFCCSFVRFFFFGPFDLSVKEGARGNVRSRTGSA